MKLIFTLTAGHTGTAYLAELFRSNIPHAEVHHEILGYDNFSVDTPDISHFHMFNTYGDTLAVREFWRRKIGTIFASRVPCYIETSHLLMKAGLVENITVRAAEKHELHFILLERDEEQAAMSFFKRGDFRNYGNMWMWYLDPRYEKNLLASAQYSAHGVIGNIVWYLHEIAARAALYRQVYGKLPNVHFHTINIEELNSRLHVGKLLKDLGFKVPEKIALPRKQNVGEGEMLTMTAEEKKKLQKLIKETAFDATAFAKNLIAKRA